MKDSLYQDKIVAVYPGSFDPITLGHLDIIERASKLFNKLIVLILNNYRKKHFFTIDERVNLVKKVIESVDFKNSKVIVESYDGMLVDFLEKNGIKFIVKGIRAISDFEYEFQQHLVNSKLANIETVFFMTNIKYSFLSSSLVREVAFFGGDISNFVPACIVKDIRDKMDKLKMEV
ncbi:MAG: pantetheine-phosphate adenylyltransferase [bacterium]